MPDHHAGRRREAQRARCQSKRRRRLRSSTETAALDSQRSLNGAVWAEVAGLSSVPARLRQVQTAGNGANFETISSFPLEREMSYVGGGETASVVSETEICWVVAAVGSQSNLGKHHFDDYQRSLVDSELV
ncbi:hypothetical protein HPB47_002000, partial [Ixodes persulcatus]